MAGLMGKAGKLPKREKIGGQEHMLAYITPQEAQILRRQGGGVAPDGGQIMHRGVPAFFGPDGAGTGPGDSGVSGAAADAGHGSGSAAPGGHGGGGGMGGSGNGSMGGAGMGGVGTPAGAGASTGPSNSGISGASNTAGHAPGTAAPAGHAGGFGLGSAGGGGFGQAIADAISDAHNAINDFMSLPDTSQTVMSTPLGDISMMDVTVGIPSAALAAVTPVPGMATAMGVTHNAAQAIGHGIAGMLGMEETTEPSSVSNPGLGGPRPVDPLGGPGRGLGGLLNAPGMTTAQRMQMLQQIYPDPNHPLARVAYAQLGVSPQNYANPTFPEIRRRGTPGGLSPQERFSGDWYR